jgi:dihydrofolate reductase
VIEDPGGAEGYEYGGWTMPYWSDDLGVFKTEELLASDALLLGRVTYEGFAAAWPNMEDPQGFADRMNSNRKYVVSSTLKTAEWNNSTIIKGNLVDAVTKLKEEPGQDILVGGSASLVQGLLRNQLVDELRMAIYPIVLGTGKRLFDDQSYTKLELTQQQQTGNGVILAVYRRA